MSSTGDDTNTWKRCNTCRKALPFGGTYYVCSVSTCNRKRTGYRFCSVECWEEHLPMMRHREAWAVEETAPTRAAWEKEQREAEGATAAPARETSSPAASREASQASTAPRRRIKVGSSPLPTPTAEDTGDDVLVVVSRFKAYVKDRFGMNTSEAVMSVLSDHLRALARRGTENARADGRKTVMDRDFDFLKRRG